jgi:hypothetical protein
MVAAALPAILWHRAIAAVASDFRIEIPYLAGWIAYAMIAVGLVFFIPVVISIGRRPDSRLYPHARNAYIGWGISCYLLGAALATQVAQIAARSWRALNVCCSHGPLQFPAGPAVSAPELVRFVRRAAGAVRPRAVRRPCADAREARHHLR